MKLLIPLSLTAGILATYLFASAARTQNGPVTAQKDRKPMAAAHRTPVIVELFTSEGCSSCPSADAELARLVRDQPFADAEIIPLSLHVDYWNNIGWKDPFSAAAYSARQREYGQAFRLDSVYTPQMVVDGKAEFVGSDASRAADAIRRAASGAKAKVSVTVADGTAKISVAGASSKGADVMLAVTEDGLSSNVRAGENSGRHLAHVAVVRSLRRVGGVDAKGAYKGSIPLALGKDWKPKRLSAVVFVQERGARKILGAAQSAIE